MDVETRWFSKVPMVARCVDLKNFITVVTSEEKYDIPTPTEEQWKCAAWFVKTLTPLHKMSIRFEPSRSVTMSLVSFGRLMMQIVPEIRAAHRGLREQLAVCPPECKSGLETLISVWLFVCECARLCVRGTTTLEVGPSFLCSLTLGLKV